MAEHEALVATEAGEHRGVRRGVSAVDEAAVEQDDLPVGALDAPHHVLDRRGVLGARLRPRSLGRIAGGYQIIHDGLDVGCRQILRHGLHRGRVRARGRGRLIERVGENHDSTAWMKPPARTTGALSARSASTSANRRDRDMCLAIFSRVLTTGIRPRASRWGRARWLWKRIGAGAAPWIGWRNETPTCGSQSGRNFRELGII